MVIACAGLNCSLSSLCTKMYVVLFIRSHITVGSRENRFEHCMKESTDREIDVMYAKPRNENRLLTSTTERVYDSLVLYHFDIEIFSFDHVLALHNQLMLNDINDGFPLCTSERIKDSNFSFFCLRIDKNNTVTYRIDKSESCFIHIYTS